MDKEANIADSLAKKGLLKGTKSFWAEIKKHTNKNIKFSAESVEGVTGHDNI